MYRNVQLFVAMFASAGLAASATAGTISVSTVAPTVDGSDQANLVASTGGEGTWGDRPVRGQTFTTNGDAGQQLVSLTVALYEADPDAPLVFDGWKDYLIRFGTVDTLSSGTLTATHEEVIRQNDDLAHATEVYHTFIFDTPIALAANTTYAFDVGIDASQNGWQAGIPNIRKSGDSYAGGQRYNGAQTQNADTDYGVGGQSGDLIFHADIVPEPGSLALMGLGGLLIARRRRG